MNIGSVFFDIKSNRGAFTKEIKSACSAAENIIGKSMGKVGAAVAAAFSVKAVTAFAKECIDLGSDLAEVQNVVDVTFGQSAEKINSWAKTTATAFGVSELQAKQFSGTMGAMLKSMGLTTDTALGMSTSIVGLAGDMASFYNLEVDTAFEKIRSGISGETEPLKQLGINMSVANLEAFALSQGITKAYNAMTQAEQATLRYNYLLSVTADSQGDFSRTSGSWANQVKVLSLQFDSLKTTIGGLLVQALTPLIRLLNEVMAAANNAASALAALFGGNAESSAAKATAVIASTASAADTAAESIENTGTAATTAAKKIKNAFAAYDEINVLKTSSDSSSSGASGGASGFDIAESTGVASAGISETENKLDSLKSKLSSLWSGFAAGFEPEKKALLKNIDSLKQNAKKVWSDIKSLGSPLKAWASTDLLSYFDTFAHTAVGIFLGLFDSANMVFSDIWDIAVFPVLQSFIKLGLPVVTQFREQFVKTLGTAFDGAKEIFDSIWTSGVVPVLDTVSGIWTDLMQIISDKWKKFGEPIFENIRDVISNTKEIILKAWENFISPCWNAVMDAVDEIWANHLKPLVDNVVDFVGEFILAAENIYNNFIAPIVMWIEDKLFPVFANTFKNILNVIKPIIQGIIDAVNGVITSLKGIVQFIGGVFSGDWQKAWTGIKNIFKGIWDTVSATLKTPINAIFAMIENLVNRVIGAINKLIQGFNKIKWDVPDWVPAIGGKSVGFNIKQISTVAIPRLAEGGWVAANNPQLVMVGDNKREGEIIAPESKITEAVEKAFTMIRELKMTLELIVVYPDGRRIIKQINEAQLAEGKILLEL